MTLAVWLGLIILILLGASAFLVTRLRQQAETLRRTRSGAEELREQLETLTGEKERRQAFEEALNVRKEVELILNEHLEGLRRQIDRVQATYREELKDPATSGDDWKARLSLAAPAEELEGVRALAEDAESLGDTTAEMPEPVSAEAEEIPMRTLEVSAPEAGQEAGEPEVKRADVN